MKRILILALVAMLVVVMLAVPAFAAEHRYLFSPSDTLDQPFPGGNYLVRVWFYIGGYDDSDYEVHSEGVLTIDPDSDEYWAYGSFDFEFEGEICTVDLDFLGNGPVIVDCTLQGVRGDPLVKFIELIYEPVIVPSAADGATDSVLTVFTVIGNWIISQIPVVLTLFWNAELGQLTVIGSICVCALGVALVLLLLSLVKRWIQFR